MAKGVPFDGMNTTYNPPEGVTEDQCSKLHVFRNGTCVVSCWEFSDEEIAEIVRTKRIFHSVWAGNTLHPQAIGTENAIHALVADYGAVWKLSPPIDNGSIVLQHDHIKSPKSVKEAEAMILVGEAYLKANNST